jgi:hypothetical protein
MGNAGLVFVRKVQRLPLPEFVDQFSAEAAQLQLQLYREGGQDPNRVWSAGINRTPEIAEAYDSEEVQDYLWSLESYQGQEVAPDELVPRLKLHPHFKGAYPIPGTRILLSLSEGEPEGAERICRVMFLGEGPNLGSIGGPTLQSYGAVANICYEGRFNVPQNQ